MNVLPLCLHPFPYGQNKQISRPLVADVRSRQLFGERFKSARLLNGFSLQGLADALGNKVTKQALHKYEKGEVVPDSEKLSLISDALNVRPDYFFRPMAVELGPIEYRKLKR